MFLVAVDANSKWVVENCLFNSWTFRKLMVGADNGSNFISKRFECPRQNRIHHARNALYYYLPLRLAEKSCSSLQGRKKEFGNRSVACLNQIPNYPSDFKRSFTSGITARPKNQGHD